MLALSYHFLHWPNVHNIDNESVYKVYYYVMYRYSDCGVSSAPGVDSHSCVSGGHFFCESFQVREEGKEGGL